MSHSSAGNKEMPDSDSLSAMIRDASSRAGNIVIAAGAGVAEVIEAAVAPWLAAPPLDTAPEVVIAVPSVAVARDPAGPLLVMTELLQTERRSVRVVAPPGTIAGSLLSGRKSARWVPVAVSPAAEWLDRAWIMATVATSTPLVFVNVFELGAGRRSPSPVIGAWTRFAHPRQRVAAAATDRREGITPEIASAFNPALILLVNADFERPLAIAADDQIAGELAARALQDLHRPPNHDDEALRAGPWENSLIQRASELGIGVTWPGALRIQAVWTGSERGPGRPHFLELADRVRARIGVPSAGRVQSENP